MGQEVRGVPEAAALSGDSSIGRYLAGQRRLRGISLGELADRTHIPLRSLERLEAGAFDGQRDGFARSFVRAVADALGLDPADAVLRLLDEPAAGDPEAGAAAAWRRWVVRGAAVLVLAALGLAAWSWLGRAPEPAPRDSTEVVTRRDAVRALAEGQRAEPEREAEPWPPEPKR